MNPLYLIACLATADALYSASDIRLRGSPDRQLAEVSDNSQIEEPVEVFFDIVETEFIEKEEVIERIATSVLAPPEILEVVSEAAEEVEVEVIAKDNAEGEEVEVEVIAKDNAEGDVVVDDVISLLLFQLGFGYHKPPVNDHGVIDREAQLRQYPFFNAMENGFLVPESIENNDGTRTIVGEFVSILVNTYLTAMKLGVDFGDMKVQYSDIDGLYFPAVLSQLVTKHAEIYLPDHYYFNKWSLDEYSINNVKAPAPSSYSFNKHSLDPYSRNVYENGPVPSPYYFNKHSLDA